MPAQEIGHIWRAVNNMASRDTVPSTAPPGQNTNLDNPTAKTAASKSPPQTTPVKRTSPAAGGTVVASAHAKAPAAAPTPVQNKDAAAASPMTTVTPLPSSGGQLTLS